MAVIRHRPIRMVCTFEFATIFILTVGLALVPNYLQEEHAVSVRTIGLLGSVSAIGSILFGIGLNRIPALQRPHAVLPFVVGAVGLALLLLLFGRSIWLFGLAFLFRGGYFVAWALFYAILGDVTPERLRTRAYVVAELLGEGGFSLAPFLAGVLYGVLPAVTLVFALVALAPLLVGLAWLRRAVDAVEREDVEATARPSTP
jgi:MFS family permease